MDAATLEHRAALLNQFPEVMWDRCAGDAESMCAFGWIARDDGRSDFLVIEWQMQGDEELRWFTTSSAAMSRSFDVRMRGTDDGHMDCQRVEHVFGDLVARKIDLGRAA